MEIGNLNAEDFKVEYVFYGACMEVKNSVENVKFRFNFSRTFKKTADLIPCKIIKFMSKLN